MSEGSETYGRYGTTPYRSDGTADRAEAYRARHRGRYAACPPPCRQGGAHPFPAHVFRVSASLRNELRQGVRDADSGISGEDTFAGVPAMPDGSPVSRLLQRSWGTPTSGAGPGPEQHLFPHSQRS